MRVTRFIYIKHHWFENMPKFTWGWKVEVERFENICLNLHGGGWWKSEGQAAFVPCQRSNANLVCQRSELILWAFTNTSKSSLELPPSFFLSDDSLAVSIMQRALSCRLKLSLAPPLIGRSRMDSTTNLCSTISVPANPSSLSFPKDYCRSWPSKTMSPSRLITFTGRASSPCATGFLCTAKTVNGKELQLQETPKMTGYFWALFVLQVFSAISVGVLWYLMNLMTSEGRGGIKLWSFWLVGDQRISYISSLASRVVLFTLMLLGIGAAICLIPLVKKMLGHS